MHRTSRLAQIKCPIHGRLHREGRHQENGRKKSYTVQNLYRQSSLTHDFDVDVFDGLLSDPVAGDAPVSAGILPADVVQGQDHSVVGQLRRGYRL